MDQFRSHPLYKVHTLDSAMSSLWDFYRTRFLVLFSASVVMSLIMQFFSASIDLSSITSITDPYEMLAKMKEFILPMIILSVANLLFTTILQYYIIYSPVDKSVNIFTAVYKSLKYFIPYLIIIIIFAFVGSFALVLGLLALIIGIFFVALYLMTLYVFFLPVLMVEGPNIGNAFSRSFRLAHRGFWTNLGWVAVLVLILIVLSMVLSMIIMIPFTGTFLKVLSNPEEAVNAVDYLKKPSFIILGSMANALYFPLLPVFSAIMYFNGIAKEEEGLKETGQL